MTATGEQVERSPEVESVEAALAHLDEVEQRYARAGDTEDGVPEDVALAHAAAIERYMRAVDALPAEEFAEYVPF